MIIFLSAILFLFSGYSLLIFYYYKNWKKIPEYIIQKKNYTEKISVIIPARNEEKNIGALLKNISEQTYPQELTEIIVIDDHSEDHTAAVVAGFNHVKLISLHQDIHNSYKKKALDIGIMAASGTLIVTTDADCLPEINWLETLVSFKTNNDSVFVAAPVCFTNNSSLLEIFQALDFLVLQGITAASVHSKSHSMCNGANLAYTRAAFFEVKGFAGIDHIASGDDMLLMHKIWKQYPDKVHYVKSKQAIVTTAPMKTWKTFFNQRIRWASKAGSYSDKRIIVVLLLVYLFNLSFPVLFITAFFTPVYWYWLAGLWVAKTLVEFPFVFCVSRFYNKQNLMRYFFFFQPLHILYTIVAGFLGQMGSYEWKGRKVK